MEPKIKIDRTLDPSDYVKTDSGLYISLEAAAERKEKEDAAVEPVGETAVELIPVELVKPSEMLIEETDKPLSDGDEPKFEAKKGSDYEKLIDDLVNLPSDEFLYVLKRTNGAGDMPPGTSLSEDYEARCAEDKDLNDMIARVNASKGIHSGKKHDPIVVARDRLYKAKKRTYDELTEDEKKKLSDEERKELKNEQLKRTQALGKAAAFNLIYNAKIVVDNKGDLINGGVDHEGSLMARTIRAVGAFALSRVGIKTKEVKAQTETMEEWDKRLREEMKAKKEGYHSNLHALSNDKIFFGGSGPGGTMTYDELNADVTGDVNGLKKQEKDEYLGRPGWHKNMYGPMDEKLDGKNMFSLGERFTYKVWGIKHQINPKDSYELSGKNRKEELSKTNGLEDAAAELEDHYAIHKFLNRLDIGHNRRLLATLSVFLGGDYYGSGAEYSMMINSEEVEQVAENLGSAINIDERVAGYERSAKLLDEAINSKSTDESTPEGATWLGFLKKAGGNKELAESRMRQLAKNLRDAPPEYMKNRIKIAHEDWENRQKQLANIFHEGEVLGKDGKPLEPRRRFTFGRIVKGSELSDGFSHELGMGDEKAVDLPINASDRGTDFIEIRIHFPNNEGKWPESDEGNIYGYINTRTGDPVCKGMYTDTEKISLETAA